MHRYFLTFCGILTIGLFSCSGNHPKETTSQDTSLSAAQPKKGNAPSHIEQKVQIQHLENDSMTLVTVVAKEMPDSIQLNIANPYEQVHIRIKQVKADSVIATLSPKGSQRNIRINQIIMPDNTMDGPFGNVLRYPTKQQGDYTLVLGKDNMADGVVEGALDIHIQLK